MLSSQDCEAKSGVLQGIGYFQILILWDQTYIGNHQKAVGKASQSRERDSLTCVPPVADGELGLHDWKWIWDPKIR